MLNHVAIKFVRAAICGWLLGWVLPVQSGFHAAAMAESVAPAPSSPGAAETANTAETPAEPALLPLPMPPSAEAVAPTASVTLSAESVNTFLETVRADMSLPETARAQAEAALQQTLKELDAASQFRAQAATFQAKLEQLPREIERWEAELAATGAPPQNIPSEASPTELESLLQKAEAALAEAGAARDAVEMEGPRRAAVKRDTPALIEAAQKKMQTAREQLAQPPASDSPAALTQAQRWLRQAQIEAAAAEIDARQKEVLFYDRANETLLPLRRRVTTQKYAAAEEWVRRLKEELAKRRKEVAEETLSKSKDRLSELPPQLSGPALKNRELASDVRDMVARVEKTEQQLSAARATLDDIRRRFDTAKERMTQVGLTGALGVWLQAQKASLPDVRALRKQIADRQEEIRKIQWKTIELSENHAALPPIEQTVEQWRNRIPSDADYDLRLRWWPLIDELVQEQYRLIEEQLRLYQDYLDDLVELDNVQQSIIRRAGEYTSFIDEHILWIRSAPAVTERFVEQFRLTLGVVRLLLGPDSAQDLLGVLLADVVGRVGLWAAAVSVYLLLLLVYRPLRAKLREAGKQAAGSTYRGFLPTWKALVITCLLPFPVVLPLWFLAWRLAAPSFVVPTAWPTAVGLGYAGLFYYLFDWIRHLCRGQGLAEAHFGWPEDATRWVYRRLRWFVPLGTILVFLWRAVQAAGDDRWQNGPGRLLFAALLVLYAVMLGLLLHPRGKFIRAVGAVNTKIWIYRSRVGLFAIAVLSIAFLGAASLAGYHYTAMQLAERLRNTLLVPVVLGVAGGLFSRWTLVRKRRLALDRWRRTASAPVASEGAEGGPLTIPAEPEPDLTLIGLQTQKLFSTAQIVIAVVVLGWIWGDVLPALGILRQVTLWHIAGSIQQSQTAADGAAELVNVPVLRAITLGDMLLAGLILAAGFVAAKNISGLMEIALPPKIRGDTGLRYAIDTLTGYGVTIVAIIWAFGRLGIGWTQVQWLVAAVGVGLGFGLQEIFANFVSGLILLFERPIRVGDVVTLGEYSGVVSRIRIRATTLLNFERKELIVPNKDLITGRILNWTLSDAVNRVEVAVGVAYGTNPDQVIEILTQVAEENPYVTKDIPPAVLFAGFGDSSLNFKLFAYLPSLENRLPAINSLHAQAARKLAEAGIQIPFPHREVFLHQVPPVHGGTATESDELRDDRSHDLRQEEKESGAEESR
ncbi:mechanosensitive ion channel domain-containing protein [Thermopirellula anaerolimosa]